MIGWLVVFKAGPTWSWEIGMKGEKELVCNTSILPFDVA
jgi:hypothetical protein